MFVRSELIHYYQELIELVRCFFLFKKLVCLKIYSSDFDPAEVEAKGMGNGEEREMEWEASRKGVNCNVIL